MQTIQVQGTAIPLNSKGMLLNFDDWNKAVAKEIAKQDGLELTECHWAAINFLREYYHEFGVPSSPRVMLSAVGHKMSTTGKCNGKELKTLFPKGGCKHACRIAGLPREYCNAC